MNAKLVGHKSKRIIFLLFLFGLLYGCATAEVGMSIDDFKESCLYASWQNATEIKLDSSRTIVVCPVTGGMKDTQYQLFVNGVLEEIVPEDELIAMAEDLKCKSFHAEPGTPDYTQCRVTLAQMRFQAEQNDKTRQQNAAQQLLMLQAIQQPQEVNVNMNCTSSGVGSHTSYRCN